MTTYPTAKLAGATEHLDRSVSIGEELTLVVEVRVLGVHLEKGVELAIVDAYELGRGNDFGDRVLALERGAFTAREDERKGRQRLPLGAKLEDEQAALESTIEELTLDEATGVAKVNGDDAPDDELAITDADLEGFDAGDEPFPDEGQDEELDRGPSLDDDRLALKNGASTVATIPARLFGEGPSVTAIGPDDVLKGTIGDVKERLAYVDSREALELLEGVEKDGKDRKGIVEAIGKRAAELTLGEDGPEPELPDAGPDVPEDAEPFGEED